MNLLALDTATEACSAALLHDGRVAAREEIAPRRHGELILPMIDELLAAAGLRPARLDAIAFGRGPGAFTGVRIAAGVAQGLAYAADLPVIPVSSLAALAQAAVPQLAAPEAASPQSISPPVASADRPPASPPAANADATILAAMDARLGEVYCCQYRIAADLVRPLGAETVVKPDQVAPDTARPIFGIGSGWDAYAQILQTQCRPQYRGHRPQAYPSAAHILPLALPEYQAGNLRPPQEAVPVYLRNRVVG